MIVELVVRLLAALVSALGGLFGTVAVPAFIESIPSAASELVGYAAGYGQWFPIADAIQALTFVVSVTALGFGIKVARVVTSLFTGGGGSAS